MSAIGSHPALAGVGRPWAPEAWLSARRHAGAAASLPMSSNYCRGRHVSRAALNIPPDALVHPKTVEHEQWGIEKEMGDKDENEKVRLWFLIPGVEVSKVQDEVEVNLPDGSNVLTIKKKDDKTGNADEELLDVRLLLTEEYDTKGIKVRKGTNKDGKVRLEVNMVQNNSSMYKINIK